MKQPICPAMLKTLRERRGLSQAKLEARSEEMHQKVGIATIKRIETWDGTYMATPTVAERLSKTLGVGVEDLCKVPATDEVDHKRKLRKLGMRQVRATVHENTMLSFRMVEFLYGIPVRAQIEMAPLFMALLAEGSLAWRKKRLSEIDEKADELMSLGGGNFSFAHAVSRIQDAAFEEEQSIRKRDVFGKDVAQDTYDLGYNPNFNNPFADYLREQAQAHGGAEIVLDPAPFGSEIGQFGFPEYRIGIERVNKLTGNDPDAEYALACGHVNIADIPTELQSEDTIEKRVEWIISHIPDDEVDDRKARREDLNELLARNDPGLSETNQASSEGNQNDS
ncbi:helix-turn-helix transcriptional regulator [Ruegeria sp. HKCCA0235A]|uniref:helix-turn-helix domain-containing protein n=1 Tax=Ruegeria sp. HKCCA0235A TaxID=2682998 RepID=UPI001C2CC4CB|nr:helix-turn-helix transcriptional regulator [Ruegeria sp. HKCCA0235A]